LQNVTYLYTCPSGYTFIWVPDPLAPHDASGGMLRPYNPQPRNASTGAPPAWVDTPLAGRMEPPPAPAADRPPGDRQKWLLPSAALPRLLPAASPSPSTIVAPVAVPLVLVTPAPSTAAMPAPTPIPAAEPTPAPAVPAAEEVEDSARGDPEADEGRKEGWVKGEEEGITTPLRELGDEGQAANHVAGEDLQHAAELPGEYSMWPVWKYNLMERKTQSK